MSILAELQSRFAAAISKVANQPESGVDPLIKLAGDPKFGDFQCNAALPLAKPLRRKPREIAQEIVDAVQLDDLAESLELAGPGFINIRLRADYLAQQLMAIPAPPTDLTNDRWGIPATPSPSRVAIDYSSPNIAKQMHVGHLRSTIIGDVFARVLGFLGHTVFRFNHVGDWGTQFGMLIAWYREHPLPNHARPADQLAAIEDDYRAAQERFKSDPEFATTARNAVGQLQQGDENARAIWTQLCDISRDAFINTYEWLGVLLTAADIHGESFYNERLADVVALIEQNLGGADHPRAELRIDDGALCIFLFNDKGEPAYKNPEGNPLPMIIRKRDGAFLYSTTDCAALHYRAHDLQCDRLIYVTDARQKQHFAMLFEAGRAARLVEDHVSLEHVTFGSVLGDDRRPLKTRDGQNVRLADLLDEAERRAASLLAERDSAADDLTLSAEQQAEVARAVGIGAVKYADLRSDRNSDYVFEWDKMLALQGNTAPYMMYAYARIRSIQRKAAEAAGHVDLYATDTTLTLNTDPERLLALKLLRFPDTIATIAADLLPHILCTYLYELATDFTTFYQNCSVNNADTPQRRASRLRLCDLTARALRLGLNLLGIRTIERM